MDVIERLENDPNIQKLRWTLGSGEEITWYVSDAGEHCPSCESGMLIGQNGGGVKCNKCWYWFCF